MFLSGRKSSKKDEGNLEAFIATLMTEPVTQNDPTSGFVLSLAEGLRRLPYKERAKLQIEFLSRVMEIQNRLGNNCTYICICMYIISIFVCIDNK